MRHRIGHWGEKKAAILHSYPNVTLGRVPDALEGVRNCSTPKQGDEDSEHNTTVRTVTPETTCATL